ncbi:MAG: type IV secretory system conjugative DNA transfer family protein [Sinobacteraceae bacterium]|nr:type IV secretory system conjugative DNA transfer family protein [Nevskiaceae bacterium]
MIEAILLGVVGWTNRILQLGPWIGVVTGAGVVLGWDRTVRGKDGRLWYGLAGLATAVFTVGVVVKIGASAALGAGVGGWKIPAAAFGGGVLAGVVGAWAWLRYGAAHLDDLQTRLVKRTKVERERRTDVRTVSQMLPDPGRDYDPHDYFRPPKSAEVFAGLDERGRPVYLDHRDLAVQHILLCGRTRAGKGVAAQMLIPQLLERGEYVVVLDPKGDEFMPRVFEAECRRLGLPYRFLDLNPSAPEKTNVFTGCDAEALESMFIGAFALAERGEAADYYRLKDRKAAREAAAWIVEHPGSRMCDAIEALGEDWADEAPAFLAYARELAEIPAVNASKPEHGIAETSGMLYVLGDMLNSRVLRAQRMILLHLLYAARAAAFAGEKRRCLVFADEFKAHVSKPFMTSLAVSAGWGLHAILAMQSLQDLYDVPADCHPDAVRGAVLENCAVQMVYALKDPDTAHWISRSTGTILVDDEVREVERNVAQTEIVAGRRTIRQAERNLVDVNMLLSLPRRVAVLTRPGTQAMFVRTSPMVCR